MPAPHPNIEILEFAAARLGPVLGELVFLGGCATGLLSLLDIGTHDEVCG